MKAVIMAGGEGSRLRPLTCDMPKPMARLCGRPIMEYILELLGKNGFTRAGITLRYLPERIISHFSEGTFGPVALDFFIEDTPLGTAGSVKNACTPDDNEILVISGDAMCDFDLAAAVQEHRATKADVTIIAKKVGDPREYGLIDVREDGSINAFIEKPAFSQAISDLANTGIYILSRQALDLIPDGKKFDFAKDLFPLMLGRGMRLMCREDAGYWCDIGDLASYIRCQRDMLDGAVSCDIHGERDGRGNIFRGEIPHSCIISPPVYLGKNVTVDENAVIEAGSVIDDGAVISRDARISGSVLLPGSYAGARVSLTGALICSGGVVKTGSMLFECSTVGAGAVVGENCTVSAGVKIWNEKVIPDGTSVTEHVKTGLAAPSFFTDEGIVGQVGVEITPEFCARLGAAIGSLKPGQRVAVGGSAHHASRVLKDALSAGIQSAGSGVMDFGENFQAMFEFSMNFCGAELGVFIKTGRRGGIRVMDLGGLPATRETERSIEGGLSRGEFIRADYDAMGDRVEMAGMPALYRAQLIRLAPKGLEGSKAMVRSNNLQIQELMRGTLQNVGCDTSCGFRLEISSQGDKVRIFDPELGWIPHHRILAWCAMSLLEHDDVALSFDAPQLIDRYSEKTGHSVHRYFACPADDSDAQARKLARVQMWSRDALMQSMMLLGLIRRYGGLEQLAARYPVFDVKSRTIDTDHSPAGLLRTIGAEKTDRITEGVLLRSGQGVVLVRPLKRGQGVRILAEALSAETAAELCDGAERLIRESMDQVLPKADIALDKTDKKV